jgi:hypothetical protein
MAFLLNMVRRFEAFSVSGESALQQRHEAEEARLRHDLAESRNPKVQAILAETLDGDSVSREQAGKLYSNMAKFAHSMEGILAGATSKGVASCDDPIPDGQPVCHRNALCTDTSSGIDCVCNEGFVGDGKTCEPPPDYKVRRLLYEGAGGLKTMAADINVAIFGSNQVAVVFRDRTKGDIGRVLVGHVRESGRADMAPSEQFTSPGGRAFDPVVTGTEDQQILVAWRDEFRKGSAWVRGASLGAGGVHGASLDLDWGEPLFVVSDQAIKSAVVPLPGNRVALFLSDKVPPTPHTEADLFGLAELLQIEGPSTEAATQVKKLGSFRFFTGGICRLEVTKLSSTSFVVAGRAEPSSPEDMELIRATSNNREAIAIYGKVQGDDLVFDPIVLNLEPDHQGVWARGLSLIGPNTFAYSYQWVSQRYDGAHEDTQAHEAQIKIAVVQLDSVLNKMVLKQAPVQAIEGFSPYVRMISVPYSAEDPHTLMYFQGENTSKVHICKWTGHVLGQCEDMTWLPQKVTSVSGIHLGGGRNFMAFTAEDGTPYYTVFGLAKK